MAHLTLPLEIRPITFKAASTFVLDHHRHNAPPVGCKFCIGLYSDGIMVGCAICGRPVSRRLDDGLTCEITRVCVIDGIRNGCSMLYGAACRVAKAMGYKRVVTYTLESENGASVKASNFVCAGKAGREKWNGVRDTGHEMPHEKKTRWEIVF